MAVIHVPRPPKSAFNPGRKASSLLRNQVEHMHIAEKRLPEQYRTKIYVNAIQTEGEVAEYIGQVTKAITQAHEDARKRRARSTARRGKVQKIAAKADASQRPKSQRGAAGGKSAIARGEKKTSKSK